MWMSSTTKTSTLRYFVAELLQVAVLERPDEVVHERLARQVEDPRVGRALEERRSTSTARGGSCRARRCRGRKSGLYDACPAIRRDSHRRGVRRSGCRGRRRSCRSVYCGLRTTSDECPGGPDGWRSWRCREPRRRSPGTGGGRVLGRGLAHSFWRARLPVLVFLGAPARGRDATVSSASTSSRRTSVRRRVTDSIASAERLGVVVLEPVARELVLGRDRDPRIVDAQLSLPSAGTRSTETALSFTRALDCLLELAPELVEGLAVREGGRRSHARRRMTTRALVEPLLSVRAGRVSLDVVRVSGSFLDLRRRTSVLASRSAIARIPCSSSAEGRDVRPRTARRPRELPRNPLGFSFTARSADVMSS